MSTSGTGYRCVSAECSPQGTQYRIFGLFSTTMAGFGRTMAKGIICLIRCYRYCISPLLGNRCRFYPSCSEYAAESFKRFGFIKGFFLATRRLLKCHPWCKGFHDPVPPL